MNYERHGMRKTKEYKIWLHMKDRCCNPRNKDFSHYGERGIEVCEEWKNSFTTFFNDMGNCPDGYSIERIDNNGNYCKANCRWATRGEQSNNTRQNRFITVDGTTKTLQQWCAEYGIDRFVLADRLNRGWSPEKAIHTPTRHSPKRMIEFDGQSKSLSQWARDFGLLVGTLHQWLQRGLTMEEIAQRKPEDAWHMLTYNGRSQTISSWSRETGITRSTIRRRLKQGFDISDVLKKGRLSSNSDSP